MCSSLTTVPSFVRCGSCITIWVICSIFNVESVGASLGTQGYKLIIPDGIAPVQLVRKPEHAQGQLEITDEGMDVLLNLTSPFALVSAVGPTRTGKSSLLGRAFLGLPQMFEIGTGVHSHTTGIWCINKPITVITKRYGKMSVLFIDTEGFHGVQEKTSKTYENNLFAVSYLLSSVLIYNSAYPVDSHHVDELKGYSRTAIDMQKTLQDSGVHINRNRPDLLWVVQNFNFYNLNNSGMSGNDLLGNLTDTTMLETLGMADESLNNLHGMFRSKGMAPLHRPHNEDKVLANLGAHADQELNREYMKDLMKLKQKVYTSLEPMQVGGVNIDGKDFALNIERWVLYGHIRIDEDQEGVHFVDKRMEGHVQEVLSEYSARSTEMETRIKTAGTSIDPMNKFRKALDDTQAAALEKLKQRAKFWNYKLQGSPLETHLRMKITARGKDLLHLYTGQALRVFGKYMEAKKADAVEGVKKTMKFRQSLQAIANPQGKQARAPDTYTDAKAVKEAVRAVTRPLESAVKREAARYELSEDRIGKQYVEEFRRWTLALGDVLMFTFDATKVLVNTLAQDCTESGLTDVSKSEYDRKCGGLALENAEKNIRDRALEVLPGAYGNSTDPNYQSLVRWAASQQRAAVSGLVSDTKSTFKRAAETSLAKIAGGLLTGAEQRAKKVGGVRGMFRGNLEKDLDQMVLEQLAEFDLELQALDLDAQSGEPCALSDAAQPKKGDAEEEVVEVACSEYRTGLEQQVRATVQSVLRRQRTFNQVFTFFILAIASTGGFRLYRMYSLKKKVKLFDKV